MIVFNQYVAIDTLLGKRILLIKIEERGTEIFRFDQKKLINQN